MGDICSLWSVEIEVFLPFPFHETLRSYFRYVWPVQRASSFGVVFQIVYSAFYRWFIEICTVIVIYSHGMYLVGYMIGSDRSVPEDHSRRNKRDVNCTVANDW